MKVIYSIKCKTVFKKFFFSFFVKDKKFMLHLELSKKKKKLFQLPTDADMILKQIFYFRKTNRCCQQYLLRI